MQFQVPQFIEAEDKIIGPLTLKQFLFVAAGGAICLLGYFFLQFWLWVPVAIIAIVVSASLAFIQINGRPLPTIVAAAIGFYWNPRFYLWKQNNLTRQTAEINISGVPKRTLKFGIDNLWEKLKTSKNPVPEREVNLQPSILDRAKSSKERFEIMRKISGEQEAGHQVDFQ